MFVTPLGADIDWKQTPADSLSSHGILAATASCVYAIDPTFCAYQNVLMNPIWVIVSWRMRHHMRTIDLWVTQY